MWRMEIMANVGGDAAHMRTAAAAMNPVVTEAEGQVRTFQAIGRDASDAAGDPAVAAAATALMDAIAKAVSDSGQTVNQLGSIAVACADNLEKAGGRP
jgi:hypothetical protein